VYASYSLSDKIINGFILAFVVSVLVQDAFWIRILMGLLPIVLSVSCKSFILIIIGYILTKLSAKALAFPSEAEFTD